MPSPPVPVGVRLPLASPRLGPDDLVAICRAALELGFTSFWAGDHVLLPETNSSPYPHTGDGHRPFRAESAWLDPLLQLGWLSAQLPQARFGTSVLILPLRQAPLLAKQLATLSWLSGRPFSLGVGSGWLREEYDAVGAVFDGRATRARADIAEIRELLTDGRRSYRVTRDGAEVDVPFVMRPTAPAPVEFLWGGVSPLALRMVARDCDGWLPAKQDPDDLVGQLGRLRAECVERGRDFAELRLVVKPGPGPDPAVGAIDRAGLDRYAEMGFHEAVLELPLDDASGVPEIVAVLERVAARSW